MWKHFKSRFPGANVPHLPEWFSFDTMFVEFWGLPPLIPLLQCVNRLGFVICSVNSCQSEQGSLVTLIQAGQDALHRSQRVWH